VSPRNLLGRIVATTREVEAKGTLGAIGARRAMSAVAAIRVVGVLGNIGAIGAMGAMGALGAPGGVAHAASDATATSATPTAAAAAPQLFAPGVVSGPANDGSPTFSPDGNTLFFTRSGATWSVILESHRAGGAGGHWTAPVIAPFSGQWPDSGPAMAPDGSFLVFASVRPAAAPPRADAQGARPAPAMVGNIWRVDRTGAGWGEPYRLPDTVNLSGRVFRPTVAADGSIYVNAMEKDTKFRLYRSQCDHGTYLKAEPLSWSDGTTGDVDAEVAPDESFLIFSSGGRTPGDTAHERLFIVQKTAGGAWGAVTPLRYAGDGDNGGSTDNEPRLSPDHRTLYFTSDRTMPVHFPRSREQAEKDLARLETWDNSNSNVWSISLAPWLDAHRGT
jgi:Tol biopolymer transport system component